MKNTTGKIKYVVNDQTSDVWSEFYQTYEEAKNDLDNDISHVWSEDAKVVEVNVND